MSSRTSTIYAVLRHLPSILRFNFHYLPWRQAIRLPFILYRPRLLRLGGKVELNCPARFGLVRLGSYGVSIYPNSGIIFENNGGQLVINGPCTIGSASAVSIGEHGRLELGSDLMANAAIKIICYHQITIGDHCRLGWENMIMDTDFHSLTRADGSQSRGYGKIVIGNNCWLGTSCLLLKNTRLPAYTTVQARTVLSQAVDCPERCVIGTDSKVTVKATGTYRDLAKDRITYPQNN